MWNGEPYQEGSPRVQWNFLLKHQLEDIALLELDFAAGTLYLLIELAAPLAAI